MNDTLTTYMDIAFLGDENTIRYMVQGALARGMTAEDIALDIFQPALDAIKECHDAGLRIHTIRQEDVLYRVLKEQLQEHFKAQHLRNNRPILMGCVHGEQHSYGIEFVYEFLRHDGWSVINLGANVSVFEFVQQAREVDASVVMLSCSENTASELYLTARSIQKESTVPILVGGHYFRVGNGVPPPLTYMARDARGALDQIRQLDSN